MDVIHEIIQKSAIGPLSTIYKSIVLLLFSSIVFILVTMLVYLISNADSISITFGY